MTDRRNVPNVEGAITEKHHLLGRSRPESIGVIIVGPASRYRRHHRRHVAARRRTADPADQTHLDVADLLETEPAHQRRCHA
jgi:hypothetical protein